MTTRKKAEPEKVVQDAAEDLLIEDLNRAERLVTLGRRHGIMEKIQGEVDALRHPNRLEDRRRQLLNP